DHLVRVLVADGKGDVVAGPHRHLARRQAQDALAFEHEDGLLVGVVEMKRPAPLARQKLDQARAEPLAARRRAELPAQELELLSVTLRLDFDLVLVNDMARTIHAPIL